MEMAYPGILEKITSSSSADLYWHHTVTTITLTGNMNIKINSEHINHKKDFYLVNEATATYFLYQEY